VNERVKWPEIAVCKMVGNDAAEGPNAVHYDQEIDGFGVADSYDVTAEGTEVVEGEVYTPEDEEHANSKQNIRRLLERLPIHQRTSSSGWHSGSDEDATNDKRSKLDKSQGSDCPWESDFRQQLLDHGRKDRAAS